MAEEYEKRDGEVRFPKVTYEGNDRELKEQVIHYEKGTRRILIFTVVGLLMGWFSYRYYGETFLPLKIVLAVPYKLSELLHNSLHPAVYMEWLGEFDAFFPQAPYVSRLAEYGTSALFGGAIYGSLAYFTGDKRIFTLSRYVRFGCIWAAVIGVWTAALFGANAWQVGQNNALKNVSGFFIEGEWSGTGYLIGMETERGDTARCLQDAFYEGQGPRKAAADIREPEGEQRLGLYFGKLCQGDMCARIHPELGYLVTDEGLVYEMTDAFMEVYRECVEVENSEAVEN